MFILILFLAKYEIVLSIPDLNAFKSRARESYQNRASSACFIYISQTDEIWYDDFSWCHSFRDQ